MASASYQQIQSGTTLRASNASELICSGATCTASNLSFPEDVLGTFNFSYKIKIVIGTLTSNITKNNVIIGGAGASDTSYATINGTITATVNASDVIGVQMGPFSGNKYTKEFYIYYDYVPAPTITGPVNNSAQTSRTLNISWSGTAPAQYDVSLNANCSNPYITGTTSNNFSGNQTLSTGLNYVCVRGYNSTEDSITNYSVNSIIVYDTYGMIGGSGYNFTVNATSYNNIAVDNGTNNIWPGSTFIDTFDYNIDIFNDLYSRGDHATLIHDWSIWTDGTNYYLHQSNPVGYGYVFTKAFNTSSYNILLRGKPENGTQNGGTVPRRVGPIGNAIGNLSSYSSWSGIRSYKSAASDPDVDTVNMYNTTWVSLSTSNNSYYNSTANVWVFTETQACGQNVRTKTWNVSNTSSQDWIVNVTNTSRYDSTNSGAVGIEVADGAAFLNNLWVRPIDSNCNQITTGNITFNAIHSNYYLDFIRAVYVEGASNVSLYLNTSADNVTWSGKSLVLQNLTNYTWLPIPLGNRAKHFEFTLEWANGNETSTSPFTSLEFTTSEVVPESIINLGYSVSLFNVTHYWDAPLGTVQADSYNISLNGTWFNGTVSTNITNTVAPHSYSYIEIYPYNSTYGFIGNVTSENVTVQNYDPPDYTIGSMGWHFGMHVTNHMTPFGNVYFSQHYGSPDKTGTALATTEDGINYQFIRRVVDATPYNSTYNSKTGNHSIGSMAENGWEARSEWNTSGFLVYHQNDTSIKNGTAYVNFTLMIDDVSSTDTIIATLDIYNGSAVLNTTDIYRSNFTEAFEYTSFILEYNNTEGQSMEFRINWSGNTYIKSDKIVVISYINGTEYLTWDDAYASFGNVVYDNGTYYLVYEGWCGDASYCKTDIGLATSTDGENFTKYRKNPLLTYNSSASSWESDGIGTPFLFKDNGIWYLTYHAWHADLVDTNNSDVQIGVASGADIYSLTKYADNPILRVGDNGTWDEGTVGKRSILEQSGYYYMAYEGSTKPNATTGFQLSNWSSGIARSDCIACNNWTKYWANPVLPIAEEIAGWSMGNEQPDLVIIDNTTYFYYRPYGWLANRVKLQGSSTLEMSALWNTTAGFVEDTPLQDMVAELNTWLNFSVLVEPDIDGDTITCANNLTGTMANCNFNWTVVPPQETKYISFNISDGHGYLHNETITVKVTDDITPPDTVTNLQNDTEATWINWSWTNPSDIDFNHSDIYINGIYNSETNNSFFNLSGLVNGTERTIGIYTVDDTGNINSTWVGMTTVSQPRPPASITNLTNVTTSTSVNWSWNNPADSDFNHTMIYINNTWITNISATFYLNTSFAPNTQYTISIRTVDTYGNINASWVNQTTTTDALMAEPLKLIRRIIIID